MDVSAFLEALRAEPGYRDQIVHTRVDEARPAAWGAPARPLDPRVVRWLGSRGVRDLYTHQAEALDAVSADQDVAVVTGTSSGKSLCYLLPMLEMLLADPGAAALLVFPTKALCQDQHETVVAALAHVGLGGGGIAGVYDGDTPPAERRRLRDQGRVVLTNPDMLHASLLAGHARWSRYLSGLRLLVLDELHVYTGMFGTHVGFLCRRLERVLRHYGASPRLVTCSATMTDPAAHAAALTGRRPLVIDRDGSPRGRRTWVLWNPPRERGRPRRSRRPANDEAQTLMCRLLEAGCPTITFSKARVTAEMIYRYVSETLRANRPGLERRVAAYRGGYLPEERRRIEAALWSGELWGVSTTPALELGIDVGSLEACIIVGYPGTVSSLRQQAGRAGRGERESLVVLIGLDTSVNQYVLRHPEYLFDRVAERAVVDPGNPFAMADHLWCAASELPLTDVEAAGWGAAAPVCLEVLEAAGKLTRRGESWHHATSDDPHHEVSLRTGPDRNVVILDADSGRALGEVGMWESMTLVYPGAVYLHHGETWRVLELDLVRARATVRWEQTEFYTHPEGGTDVRAVDRVLRKRVLGTGWAFWGEVTAHLWTEYYEKVSFHTLDAVSKHGVELPRLAYETMACWIVPPEELMREVVDQGLDPHAGLRGIGYATRMLLPLFVTCGAYDFSHSVGCVNAPWNAIFVYERFPYGLGFTLSLYDRLGEVLRAVERCIRECDCADGCPRCTGKPLRSVATWNVERGEASIPSKRAALHILRGLTRAPLDTTDTECLTESPEALRLRLERALARRLERGRDPELVFAANETIPPVPPEGWPARQGPAPRGVADSETRRRRSKDLARRLRGREQSVTTPPGPPASAPPAGEAVPRDGAPTPPDRPAEEGPAALAARARRLKRERRRSPGVEDR